MKVKEEGEQVGLKLCIQKTKIMASVPIISWKIDGETVETVTLYFGTPKSLQMVTAAMKWKVNTNLATIIKIRDITLPTKVHLVKGMVFPVVMYGFESWTIKNAEPWRIDAFEVWCWRRLLRVPWIPRRSIQTILKEISPEFIGRTDAEAETLQYFGHLMQKADSFEKILMLGMIEGRKRRG